jgi:hypothetical protein
MKRPPPAPPKEGSKKKEDSSPDMKIIGAIFICLLFGG